MKIPILLEPIAQNGYRASAGQPFGMSADGSTPEEAFSKLRAAVNDELKHGKQIVLMDVTGGQNPWLALAGTIDPTDPLVSQWKEEVTAYRREKDDDPNWP